MKRPTILSARDAVQAIPDGAAIFVDAFLTSCLAQEVLLTMREQFLETYHPSGLSLTFAAGAGDGKGGGLDCIALPGLLKSVIGGHWNLLPSMRNLAETEQIEAYNLPQGVITHMIRDGAAKRPGTLTRVGLGTFVDPRQKAGSLNAISERKLMQHLVINGEECLLYKPLQVDIAILRGSVADMRGNISYEKEGLLCCALSAAQAAHNNGGKVIVQVERVLPEGELLPASKVVVPGIYVDHIVIASDEKYQAQTFLRQFDPAICGDVRVPLAEVEPLPLDARKVIARRAAMEIQEGAVVNLGIGMPEGIGLVLAEQGQSDRCVLTVEAGPVGGVPLSGLEFGCAVNFDAMLTSAQQFDFYQGGGLDIAFLGLAQADACGNVNVSRFGPRIAGCGGFIDITQNSDHVVFCGTFTAKGKYHIADGKLTILQEGSVKKFLKDIDEITFSGVYAAREAGKRVMFITERAVFVLTQQGLELTEYAPGIDIEKDILAQMEFRPIVRDPKLMDSALFT